ncbi:MAG: hypothetical protein NT039_04895, partial [Candidatus Berkelbacteria bacterium]|nr:hypothetical protein [Candidatus Berkelbacteria bacterium]
VYSINPDIHDYITGKSGSLNKTLKNIMFLKKKGFYIEVTNNLLDPKHRSAMKEAVWLFMWYLDKMTSIDEKGLGWVLGKKPIKYNDVKQDLGISVRTYRRWTDQLKAKGYTNVLRTPYGCVISVNKARKRFGRSVNNGTTRCAKNGTSVGRNGTSNKTTQLDKNNKDISTNNNFLKKIRTQLTTKMKMPVG